MTVASAGAEALPLMPNPADAPAVERVADGCGPGFFRNRRGFCRPMRAYGPPRYYAPPRRFYGPRRCVTRLTPFGPRTVCR
jgi:hypothetical protein